MYERASSATGKHSIVTRKLLFPSQITVAEEISFTKQKNENRKDQQFEFS